MLKGWSRPFNTGLEGSFFGGRACPVRNMAIKESLSWQEAQQKKNMRPISQFRFVQTVVMVPPALSQEVKYLAVYNMDDGRLAVLAQGKDKYTLKKWAGILRVRHTAVSVVDDIYAALEFARAQEGFEEHGSFGHPRGGSNKPLVAATSKKQAKTVEPERPPAPLAPTSEKTQQAADPYNSRAYQMARASAQQAIRRIEFREESIRLSQNPPGFETDVDRTFVRRPPATGDNPVAISPYVMAGRAALQYARRLHHEGRLPCLDAVPHALRKELVSGGAVFSSRYNEEEDFGF